MAEISFISTRSIVDAERWDAEFFSPKPANLLKHLENVGCDPLSKFIESAQRGLLPAYDTAGSVPVIRTVNVRETEFSDVRQEYVSQKFLDSTPKGKIEYLDIAITSTGVGTLGRAFCNLSHQVFFADGHITVLTPKPDSDHAYLTAVLQSSIGQIQFEQWQRGSSGQIEIYPEDILEIRIPKLPEALQSKISTLWKKAVNLIERAKLCYPEAEQELLERIGWNTLQKTNSELYFVVGMFDLNSAARVDAEHFQPKYKRLRERLKSLGAASLGSLTDAIHKGTQPKRYFDDGEVVVVKSKDVFGQGINFDNCERTTLDAFDDINARLTEGDVVMNSTGFGTLGRAGFVPANLKDKTVAAVDLLKITPKLDHILPEYLTLFLNSAAGTSQSEMLQTGSSGQLHLYPQHIHEIEVFLPRNKNGSIDLTWQRRLADKIVFASAAKQEAQTTLAEAKRMVEMALNMKCSGSDMI